MPAIATTAPRWDLSALFDSTSDPKIEASWKSVYARAEAFEKTYRDQINRDDLDAATLAGALKEIENIHEQASKPIYFAHLLFAANTSDPSLGAFLQSQMEKSTELSVKLMFFELELQAAPQKAIDQVLADAQSEPYRHYIKVARAYSPFRLSEKEEIILEETSNTGSRAWQRLFEEALSNHPFKFTHPETGVTEELSEEETIDRLRDVSRPVRQAAADALTAGLIELQRTLVFTYNTLIQDKNVDDRLRGFKTPEDSRHLANELDAKTVDLVVNLCKEHYTLVQRFYRVKSKILGVDQLTHIDRYAPVTEAKREVAWEEAKQIVLDAFGAFNPVIRDRAAEFFDKNWIDAEARSGKRGGAFCMYNTTDTHPVILQSYLGKMDDVMTLAHELGHGVHASLSREQTYFNFHGTLPLAELASIFGEMLVFESLVAQADDKDKLALYAEKIEGIFGSVFRQVALFSFEQRAHRARREGGEQTADQFAAMYQEELQAMFGDSIILGEQHGHWWSYISHFINVPFYVYAYAFGELLVLSLYQMAKDGGPGFGERYVNLLRLGGSETPKELMARVGIDLDSETFWRGGFQAMEKLIVEFERIWAVVSTS